METRDTVEVVVRSASNGVEEHEIVEVGYLLLSHLAVMEDLRYNCRGGAREMDL